MPVQPIDLQASGVQSATSNGGSHPLKTATMAVVYLDVTSVSGTTPQLSAWLQASGDQGTTWFDHPCDLSLLLSASQAQTTAVANKRNINGDTVVSAAAKHMAIYKHLAAALVRLAWNISGTFTGGQGFTFSARMDVK